MPGYSLMRRTAPGALLSALALTLSSVFAACGGSSSTPRPPAPEPGPGPSGDITVTGSERIGWDQRLAAGTTPQDHGFGVYVDGVRHAMNASCEATAESGAFTCSAPLPPMVAGRHTLQIVSVRLRNGIPSESDRSAELVVVKVSASAGAGLRPAQTPGFEVAVLASRVGVISDLAVAADGSLFVAELEGRVRSVRDGQMERTPALTLGDVARSDGLGLFAIALHPDFARNRHVYLAYAADTRDGPTFRVLRGREVNGVIGELAVLLDEPGATRGGWAAMRFGPDRKLYVALGGPRGQDRRFVAAGRILRLEDDGTTPREADTASPVIAETAGIVRGLGWLTDGSGPFTAQAPSDGEGRSMLVRYGRASGGARSSRSIAGFVWPTGATVAGLAIDAERPAKPAAEAATTMGARMYVAMLDGGLQPLSFSQQRGGRWAATPEGERIGTEYGPVSAIALAPDGTMYVGTAGDGQPGSPAGALLRLAATARQGR